MRKTVVILIGLGCGSIPTLAHGQQATATERYLLQERCGKLAAAAFAKDYTAAETTKDGQHISNYENHYSPKLNKCFFLEIGRFIDQGKNSKLLRLFDLNENKEYGSYWQTDKMPNFVDCLVGETRCSSEKEWRELAKPYLED
jgi:hypothetical protein